MATKLLLLMGIVMIGLILLIAYCLHIRNKSTNLNQTIGSPPSQQSGKMIMWLFLFSLTFWILSFSFFAFQSMHTQLSAVCLAMKPIETDVTHFILRIKSSFQIIYTLNNHSFHIFFHLFLGLV